MSKESKPRDRWHQVFAAATDRSGHCPSCGYYPAVHGAHRVDCAVDEAVAERERTGHGHSPSCGNTAALTALKWVKHRWLCTQCRPDQPAQQNLKESA